MCMCARVYVCVRYVWISCLGVNLERQRVQCVCMHVCVSLCIYICVYACMRVVVVSCPCSMLMLMEIAYIQTHAYACIHSWQLYSIFVAVSHAMYVSIQKYCTFARIYIHTDVDKQNMFVEAISTKICQYKLTDAHTTNIYMYMYIYIYIHTHMHIHTYTIYTDVDKTNMFVGAVTKRICKDTRIHTRTYAYIIHIYICNIRRCRPKEHVHGSHLQSNRTKCCSCSGTCIHAPIHF
jgi:hypothetical protein